MNPKTQIEPGSVIDYEQLMFDFRRKWIRNTVIHLQCLNSGTMLSGTFQWKRGRNARDNSYSFHVSRLFDEERDQTISVRWREDGFWIERNDLVTLGARGIRKFIYTRIRFGIDDYRKAHKTLRAPVQLGFVPGFAWTSVFFSEDAEGERTYRVESIHALLSEVKAKGPGLCIDADPYTSVVPPDDWQSASVLAVQVLLAGLKCRLNKTHPMHKIAGRDFWKLILSFL